jgi:protein-L-isoaspartate(D-aspartate) O-methyltransferase
VPDAAELRRRLVERLGIADERVRDAFPTVPRELFVAELAARFPVEAVHRDDVVVTKTDERGVPISSSSQPRIMATMLELLALEPGRRALEIGAGTGHDAALLKTVAGRRGRVVGVEVDRELVPRTRAALRAVGAHVRVVRATGRDGRAPGEARRLPAWGEPVAADRLAAVLRRWRERGSPGADRPRLSVELDGGESRVATAFAPR